MSHEATNWAFKQRGLKPASKIVLLALADRHNPDMGCFPSKKTLAEDCELSERSVYDQLKMLEDMGLIYIEPEKKLVRGQYASNRYILGFEPDFPSQILPSANSAVGKSAQEPSAKSAVGRRQNLPTNPVIEPCKRTCKDKGADEALAILSQEASPTAAASFIAYRRKTKGGALTATGATRLAASLRQISQLGHDPDDALGMAEERGWQTVKLDWYLREISNEQHRPSPALRVHAAGGRQDRPDPALEQIARLAGLG